MIHLDDAEEEEEEYRFFKMSDIAKNIEEECADEDDLGEVFLAKLPPLGWKNKDEKPHELD